uniref:Uncharacterized protein n=1 Tax=Arundo donax TaxID=35708 RepID=A0A0A9AQI1_ARUDO
MEDENTEEEGGETSPTFSTGKANFFIPFTFSHNLAFFYGPSVMVA